MLLATPVGADTDPAALWQAIEETRLEPDKTVVVESLEIDAGDESPKPCSTEPGSAG